MKWSRKGFFYIDYFWLVVIASVNDVIACSLYSVCKNKTIILTGRFLEQYVNLYAAAAQMKRQFPRHKGLHGHIKSCCFRNENSYIDLGMLHLTEGFMFTFDDYDLEKTKDKRKQIDKLVRSKEKDK